MENIKFLLDFAQGGNLKETIKDLKEVNSLYSDFGKQNAAIKSKLSSGSSKDIADALPQIEKLKEGYRSISVEAEKLQKAQERARLEEIKLQKAREKAFDDYEKKVVAGEKEIENANKKQVEAFKKAAAEQEKAIQSEEAAKRKLFLTTEEGVRQTLLEKKAKQDLISSIREQIKDETALSIAAKKQVNSIKELREQTNALVRLRDKQDTSTKQGVQAFDQLTKKIAANETQLKAYDTQIGRSQRNVGNYKNALEGASATFKSFGSQLLTFAGITGGVFFFKDAIEQIAKFDQSLADMRAILGLTAESKEFKFLQEQALHLGETTTASAAEVVEAYKLIASAKPELLENANALNEVTKAAITLSEASGLELPEAATALTDAMNQFGAGADQASKFINVLAAGAKFGSAEIPQITEALLKFGTAAKSSNVNIEESTALIELFAEKGIKGAEAGTALRNILLKLATAKSLPPKATAELAKAGVNTSILADKSLSLEVRLRELSKIQNNATAIVKTFGVENAVQAQALLQNVDRFKQLNEQVTGTSEAQKAAAERTDTLSGEMKKLANAWQVAVLRFAEGGGSIKNVVRFIRENLDTILDVVGRVVKAFIVYKTVLASVNAFYKSKDIIAYVKNLFAVKAAKEAEIAVTKEAKIAQDALNRTMNANIIGLVVTGIYSLLDGLGYFKTAADRAAESQERINSALEDFDKSQQINKAAIDQRIQDINDGFNREKDLRKAKGQEVDALERFNDAKIRGILERSLNARTKEINKFYEETNALAEKYHKKQSDLNTEAGKNLSGLSKEAVEDFKKEALRADYEEYAKAKGKYTKLLDLQKEQNKQLKDLNSKSAVDSANLMAEAIQQEEELTKKQVDERKRLVDEEYQKRLADIEKQKTLEETAIIRGNNDEADRIKLREQLNVEYLTSKMMLEKEFNKDFVKTELERSIAFDAIRKREAEEQKKLLEKQLSIYKELDDLETRNIKDEFDKRKVQEMQNFEEKIATLTEQGKLTAELEEGLTKELNVKLGDIEKERTKKKLEDDIKEYDEYYKERELQDYQNGLSQEEIDKNNHQRKIDFLKDEIKLRQDANEETLDLELELAREQKAIDEKRKADNKETTQQIIKYTTDSIKVIINAYEEAFNQKLQQDQSAIDKQKSNIEQQNALAAQGLENSVAEEKAILAEKEKQLLIDQKKQQKLKEVETFFNLLASYSKTNPDTAAAKAFAVVQLSKAFAAKLEDGGVVADVVAEQNKGILQGNSHKNGGIIIEAEGEEGIFSKKEMRKLGKDNFYAIKDSLKQGSFKNMGMKNQNDSMLAIVQTKNQPARADLTPLLNKMDNLQKAIEDKPVPSMHIDKDGNLITRVQTSTMVRSIVHKSNKPKGFNN